jgi:hypothetical protein
MEEGEMLILVRLLRNVISSFESSVYSSTRCPSKSSGVRSNRMLLGSMSWTLLPVPLQCFISWLIHGISARVTARVIANMPNINTVRLNAVGACGSVDGWGTMLQAGRSRVLSPDEVDFFNLPNPSSRTMALGSTQPITEMSTRNLPGMQRAAGA